MNWNKAKTILIIFFLLVNTFLFFNLITENSNENYVKDETVADTIKVLENNGISIESKLISRKNHSVDTFETDNIIKDYDEFAKKILGEDCEKISDNIYSGKQGSVEYFGDKFVITVSPEKNIILNEESCVSLLNTLGIFVKDYEYKDGIFKKKVNNLEVFSSEIIFEKSSDGIVKISGIWFENNSEGSYSHTKLKPITSVLVDFISAEGRPDGNVEISDLNLGYMVYETKVYHKSIVPIPVWELELSDKKVIYMDARSVE